METNKRPADIEFVDDDMVVFHYDDFSTHWTVEEIASDPIIFLKALHEATGDHEVRRQNGSGNGK